MSKSQRINHKKPTSALLGLYLLPKGLGLLLAFEMMRLWPDLPILYGRKTILSLQLIQAQDESLGISMHNIIQLLPHILIGTWQTIHVFAVLYISMGILLFVLRKTTLPLLVLFLLHHCFFIGNYTWSYGVDHLVQTGLFISILFGGSQVLTLKRRNWSHWGVCFLRLQLTSIYFFGGLGKAFSTSWWNGEAIWKAVQQPLASPGISIPLSAFQWQPLWTLLGYATVLIELAYPFLWIKNPFRKLILASIILMHIGIALTMGLVHFATVMIWYNLCAWDHPLLNIAKPNIKPLERSKPKLQVPIATETINTTKGGTK